SELPLFDRPIWPSPGLKGEAKRPQVFFTAPTSAGSTWLNHANYFHQILLRFHGGQPYRSPRLSPTENFLSIRVTLPCESLTDTLNMARSSRRMGVASFSSQTPCAAGLNLPAWFSPGFAPSIGKSARTSNDFMSRPV